MCHLLWDLQRFAPNRWSGGRVWGLRRGLPSTQKEGDARRSPTAAVEETRTTSPPADSATTSASKSARVRPKTHLSAFSRPHGAHNAKLFLFGGFQVPG